MRDSETNRLAQDGSPAWNVESSFRATRRPSSGCQARYTRAIPPLPTTSRTSNRPTLLVVSSTDLLVTAAVSLSLRSDRGKALRNGLGEPCAREAWDAGARRP